MSRVLAARDAFIQGDPSSSKRVHSVTQTEAGHATGDSTAGKNVYFSMLKGFSSSSLLLLITTGSGLPYELSLRVASLGVCGLTVLHTLCDFLKSSEQKTLYTRERAREMWELDNFEEGEVKEMVELWNQSGVPVVDAETALRALVKQKDFFCDLMMREELKMLAPDAHPWMTAVATFAGYSLSASLPLALARFLPTMARGLNWEGLFVPQGTTMVPWQATLVGMSLLLCLTLVMVEGVRAWSMPLLHSIAGMRLQSRGLATLTILLPLLVAWGGVSFVQRV